MQWERPRNSALDGLRALAIIAVLLFHGGVGWAQGGFLGVDLFFVLSGFLITDLLLVEFSHTGRLNLLAFWGRRARRLLPALIVMLLAVVSTVALSSGSAVPERLRGDVLASLAYVANWRLAATSTDYFSLQADPSPLEHTWSLAIEEQFYLLWPLLVIGALLAARGTRWLLTTTALVAIAASWLGSGLAVHAGIEPTSLYYRTDTRAPALLVGALLALALIRYEEPLWRRRSAEIGYELLGALALAGSLVLWVVARGSSDWLYPWGFMASAAASVAAVLVAVVYPQGWWGRFLAREPLRRLGRISYGVYLWHWPVYLAMTEERTHLSGVLLLAARVAVTLALAAGSWVAIERPVHRGVHSSRLLLPASLAASTAATALFFWVTLDAGQPHPLPASAVQAAQTAVVTPAPTPPPGHVVRPPVVHPTPRPVRRTEQPLPPRPRPTPTPVVPRGPAVPVDVLGDSVAESIGGGITAIDSGYGAAVTNRGIIGCGIAVPPRYRLRGEAYDAADRCVNWEREWASDIARDHPKVVLVVLGRHEVWDGELNGRWTNVGQADFDAYLGRQLDAAIDIASARGARVAMATSPYFHGSARPDGGQYPENDPKRVDRFNALLRQAVARHPGRAYLVDLNRKACPNGHYTSTVDGVRIRKDGVHFTSAGARYLAPWLFPQLVR